MDKMSDLRLDNASAAVFTMVNLFSTSAVSERRIRQIESIKATQEKYKALLYRDDDRSVSVPVS